MDLSSHEKIERPEHLFEVFRGNPVSKLEGELEWEVAGVCSGLPALSPPWKDGKALGTPTIFYGLWRRAEVIVTSKRGNNRTLQGNHYTISLLPNVSKIAKHVCHLFHTV